jgi:predicted DNA-binding protein (MmcQ/YjbR family)
MNNERVTEFLSALPHVEQTVQWGDNLLFWVGDKAIGGRMFCVLNLEPGQKCVASFPAGPEGAAELCEREDIMPAPYLAKWHWVCVQRWDALSGAEWKQCLTRAYELISARLKPRTLALLAEKRSANKRSAKKRSAKAG